MTDWNEEVLKSLEVATAIIRKDGPKSTPFCIYSKKTGKKLECFPSRKQAQERLAQIEFFKNK